MTLVEKAKVFSIAAHSAIGQTRKYTGEPYHVHPAEVVDILIKYSTGTVTDEQIAAAYLHDVVEDTKVTIDTVREMFGDLVAKYVSDLTDVSKPEDGNRKVRKAKDLEHTATADPASKSVKLADLISNTRSIVQHDRGFAGTYLREKAALLEVLKDGDIGLYSRAVAVLAESRQQLFGE